MSIKVIRPLPDVDATHYIPVTKEDFDTWDQLTSCLCTIQVPIDVYEDVRRIMQEEGYTTENDAVHAVLEWYREHRSVLLPQ
jgi:hypothetical protein